MVARGGMPLAGLQMPGCVHSFVQYPHYDHCASFNPVVDGVVFHPLSPITRPNVVASRCRLRRLCKRIEAGVQLVQVTLGLGHTPLLHRVVPNAFQIVQGRRREPEISHAQISFLL